MEPSEASMRRNSCTLQLSEASFLKRCIATLHSNQEQHKEHSWDSSHRLNVHVHITVEPVHAPSQTCAHLTLLVEDVHTSVEHVHTCRGCTNFSRARACSQ